MIKFLIAAAVALVAVPSVASASEFTGIRVEGSAGYDDVTAIQDRNEVTYGVAAGFDAEVYPRVIVGVEAGIENPFDGRAVSTSARVGYNVADKALVYGKIGYDRTKVSKSVELDGLRVGGGVEFKVGSRLFVGPEYNYTDFEGGAGRHAIKIRAGMRF